VRDGLSTGDSLLSSPLLLNHKSSVKTNLCKTMLTHRSAMDFIELVRLSGFPLIFLVIKFVFWRCVEGK